MPDVATDKVVAGEDVPIPTLPPVEIVMACFVALTTNFVAASERKIKSDSDAPARRLEPLPIYPALPIFDANPINPPFELVVLKLLIKLLYGLVMSKRVVGLTVPIPIEPLEGYG